MKAPDISQRDRSLFRIVIAGHVDHGKSTLVGRLLHDTGGLPDGKYEAIAEMCKRRGMAFEWAFLMDALQAERDQGVTIDTSQIWFKTAKRDYVIIDAPGHIEFLKNMVTGAAQADAALLLVDAEEGMQEQSRRHAYLLHLLGLRHIALVVNKMDLVSYEEARFREVVQEARAYLASLGLEVDAAIPVSAREGDNIAKPAPRMDWYKGATVCDALDAFPPPPSLKEKPLRFPIQDIYKFDARRILAGRIEAGRLAVGDTLLFSPSHKEARIATIEDWPENSTAPSEAHAGQSVGITLDAPIFVERGEIASHTQDEPFESDTFRAHVFWLGHKALEEGSRYTMKLATMRVPVRVEKIEHVIDTADLSGRAERELARNRVGEIVLRAGRIIALDDFARAPHTGRFVLVDGYDIAGGGIVSLEGYADQRAGRSGSAGNITRMAHRVPGEAREARSGHKGGVVWLTGLSGAGKSTLAFALEQKLFELGFNAYVLDGDNIRHGLNANLGFSPADRGENIRRIGEVAALFERAGFIAIASFISPYLNDRARARGAAENFHEIHVKADVATCEARDPKGLYARARTGELKDFTGISAPYEAPEKAELTLDTGNTSPNESLAKLLDYVETHFRLATKG